VEVGARVAEDAVVAPEVVFVSHDLRSSLWMYRVVSR
jgi:hypothetical protein